MSYSRSERSVLRKLGIADFRHMTKDKIVQFASLLPQMNPEVAKAAIEQFPQFKDMGIQLVKILEETVAKASNDAKESQQVYYDMCNDIIETLKEELRNENITSEDRARIEENMIRVAQMVDRKDFEFKKFLVREVEYICVGACVLGVAALAVLGVCAGVSGGSSDEDEDDDEDDDEEDYIYV